MSTGFEMTHAVISSSLRTFRQDASAVSTPIWLPPVYPEPLVESPAYQRNARTEVAASDFNGVPHGQ